jgi:small-conductance mechanosensitive channel
MLQIQYYHLIDAIVYLIAAIIPSYFILKSRNSVDNNNHYLWKLTMVLVGFILIQVLYHVAAIVGFRLLAKGLLEPLSMAALLFFGILYVVSMWKTKNNDNSRSLKHDRYI